ncbi:hypothetical protein [Mycobacterium gordonae]|nr:hypothetical protein [Mycobacterium gordonae]
MHSGGFETYTCDGATAGANCVGVRDFTGGWKFASRTTASMSPSSVLLCEMGDYVVNGPVVASQDRVEISDTTDAPDGVCEPHHPSGKCTPPRRFIRHNAFLIGAFVFCIAFGLALIANTFPPAEGVWFWYSYFFTSGKRLYSDMHLALQPLYVLETSSFMSLFGNGWLVSKIPAVLHLVAYCLALFMLVRQVNLTDARRAILYCCSFFVSVSSVAFMFSDYHVLADCFALYSVVALLALGRCRSINRTLVLGAVLGALSGLAITTRLNDGGALFAAVFVALVWLTPAKKLLLLLVFCLGAILTALSVVLLSGDSLRDYLNYSIVRAARIKGGGGSVLFQSLRLPLHTVEWMAQYSPMLACVDALMAAGIFALVLRPLTQRRGWSTTVLAIVGSVLVVLLASRMGLFAENNLLVALSGILVVLAYGLGILVVARLIYSLHNLKRADRWDTRQVLLLIPLALIASGSMSSGGSHCDILGPVSIFILLAALCCPLHIQNKWPRDIVVALGVLLIICTATNRAHEPYHWHNFLEKPMFADRVLYHHPDRGPMILSSDHLAMIRPVCDQIRQGGADDELLSLPLPGANYFCSIPPWHGYVQTFFDTTSSQTIRNLMEELQTNPPKWIFYQRQLTNLRVHEEIYNQGRPLEHRYLDQLIQRNIREEKWRVVYTSDYGTRKQWGEVWDNHWLLIQTR